MKPITAANKLGILLSAAPEDFQNTPITRDELDQLRNNPPEWLKELRKNGPFPRDVVAQKLGISNSGLARAGITEPLDAEAIGILLQNPPAWLEQERETRRKVLAEEKKRASQK